MTIQENILLSKYATFKIGGPARYFAVVKNTEEILEAVKFSKEKSIPFFVLGGGSNLLISDQGFGGLVIKIEIEGIKIQDDIAIAGSGVNWDDLVAYSVENNLYGLENLSLIPGTVGAAPVQNIGAYGKEVAEIILWVEAVHADTGEIRIFSNDECLFGYRTSFFKTEIGRRYIITRVAFKLSKEGILSTSYRDIAEYMDIAGMRTVNLQQLRNIIIAIRTRKLPSLAKYGTAGSFFKNPRVDEKTFFSLKEKFPNLPRYEPHDGKYKVSAAWLIDRACGLRGYRWGDVGIYENQALVIVNYGKGNADEVKILADKISQSVKEKTGVHLEREVEYV